MGASSSARGNWSRRRRLAALEASRFKFLGGQATTLPIAVLLSAEERLRQIVARSCLAVDGCSKAARESNGVVPPPPRHVQVVPEERGGGGGGGVAVDPSGSWSCSRRWRVVWGPRPSATVLTPGGACYFGRAAEQYEEPSNHGFTLSRPGGSSEKRRQPARWEWYVGDPNVLLPAQPAL